MNLTSPSQVRQLASEIGVVPSKVLGQNFLIDKNILDILIETAELSSNDQVLEVGGGLGVVTESLLTGAGRVVVIEKDRRLADHLAALFGQRKGFELICADALNILGSKGSESDAEKGRLLYGTFNKVVANMPYSAGTRILVDLIMHEQRPERIVVTVQLEVAERFAAKMSCGDYGILSLWSQLFYDVEIVKVISPTCFWPRPDVTSAIVSMVLHDKNLLSVDEREYFFALTRYVFGHRRKQLQGILKHAPGAMKVDPEVTMSRLEEMDIDLKARPENLALQNWVALVKMMKGDDVNV